MAHRVTVALSDDDFERLKYWAGSHKVTINDYLRDALDLKIRFENKDYPLPTLEIQRLNQLVDIIATLSANVGSLEHVVVSGFDSLIGLTRGDNYLLEESGDDV